MDGGIDRRCSWNARIPALASRIWLKPIGGLKLAPVAASISTPRLIGWAIAAWPAHSNLTRQYRHIPATHHDAGNGAMVNLRYAFLKDGGNHMFDRRSLLAIPLISSAQAQPAWPARSLRIIIPWPPGQATDLIGRILAQALSERLGQSVIPENRAGAGGMIGTDFASKAPPDGLTLLAGSAGPVTIFPLVQRTPYDAERDLVPVAMAGRSAYVLATHPDFPARDVPEFLARVRAAPGRYTFASSGTGATAHLVAEYFNARAGLQAVHVPFQGSTPAIVALIAGQVDYALETAAATMPHVRGGRLRGYGVSFVNGSTLTPGLPPLAEAAGIPGLDLGAWIGMMVPAGTPAAIVGRLEAEMMALMATPEVRDRFNAAGVEVDARPASAFAEHLRKQTVIFREAVNRAGVRAG